MKDFLKDHMDTLAIIGTLIVLITWSTGQNSAMNQRIDQLYVTIMEMIKEGRNNPHSS